VNANTGNVTVSNAGVVSLSSSDASVIVMSLGNGAYSLTTNRSTELASIAVTSPITNNGNATTPNIGLALSGVVAGQYSYPNVTVNSFGLVTSISNGPYPVLSLISTTLNITQNGFGVWTINDYDSSGSISSVVGSIGIGAVTNSGTVTLTNLGVVSLVASTGISVSQGSNGIWTITNTGSGSGGVSAIYGGTGISVNSNTGSVTVTNSGVVQLNAGTAIAITGGSGTFTIANNGVQQINAGGGISISSSTGSVTVANNGVVSIASGTAIAVTSSGTTWTVNNNGVTSAVQGTGIQVSSSTGAVTFTNIGVVSLAASTGIGVVYNTGGTSTITNTGVVSLTAGTGISLSAGTGSITITNSAATTEYFGTVTSSGSTAQFIANHGLGGTPRFCSVTAVVGSTTVTVTAALFATVDTINSSQVTGHVLQGASVSILGGTGVQYASASSHNVLVYCKL